jgi:hypothetical protein
MKIDSKKLVEIIDFCFDCSMDDRFNDDERSEFLALGKRLRGSLLNLLTAEFNEDVQAFIDAKQALDKVNGKLAEYQQDVDHAAKTVEEINDLLTKLDKVLSFASNFL